MFTRRKWESSVLTIAGLAMFAMLLSACGSSGGSSSATASTKPGSPAETAGACKPDSSGDPVRAVYIGPLSGPAAVYGTVAKASLELAAKEINADGGIRGRTIALEFDDDGADPARGTSAMQKATDSGPIQWLHPGLTSSEAQGIVPLARRAGAVTMGVAVSESLDDPTQYPNWFAISAGIRLNDILVAKMKQDGVKSVAMLNANDAYGGAVESRMQKLLSEAGIRVAESQRFAPTDLDMTAQVSRLIDSKPDALFIDATGRPTYSIFTAVQNSSWSGSIYAGGAVSTSFLEGAVSDSVLNRTILASQAISAKGYGGADAARVDAVREAAKAAGVDVLKTDNYVLLAYYDMLYLYRAAVDSACSFDMNDVAKALRSTPFPRSDGKWVAFDYRYSADTNYVLPGPADQILTSGKRGPDGLRVPLAG